MWRKDSKRQVTQTFRALSGFNKYSEYTTPVRLHTADVTADVTASCVYVACLVQQMQEDRSYRNDVDYDMYNHRVNRRKSLDRYAMRPGTCTNTHSMYSSHSTHNNIKYTHYTQYTHMIQTRGTLTPTCLYLPVCVYLSALPVLPDDYGDNRMVRTRSLSKISSSVARQQYVDTSDEDEYPRYPPAYQQYPHRRKNSRASSQENLGQAPPVRNNNQSLSEFFLRS